MYHVNWAHGSLGSDGEVVGRHSNMDYHPVSSKAFRSKRFTLSNVCVHTPMRHRVSGLEGDTQCLDKHSELLALLGEKAISLTYSPR